jgi:two-component system, NarL family, nitrate/nitrite response regulator NarL
MTIAPAAPAPLAEPAPTAADPATLRVLIADDHPLFRLALATAIGRDPGLDLVGQAGDGREALELIDDLEPDVAVLDQRMPELTGREVIAALAAREGGATPAVLVLSAFEDPQLVWRSVSGGAAGYFGKSASAAEICAAIETVGRGGIAFSERSAEGLAQSFARHFGNEGATRR